MSKQTVTVCARIQIIFLISPLSLPEICSLYPLNAMENFGLIEQSDTYLKDVLAFCTSEVL